MANIHTEFFDHFKYDKRDNYSWNIVSVSKDEENKRSVFCGTNKEDKNDILYVKQFKISFELNEKFDNAQILKEIYFLVLLRNQNYIVQLEDILFDDNENFKRVFLIFKGNCVSLNKLINFSGDYLSNKELIKWIIYQITFGLYILHNNNIIHNDIKPSNILINEVGGITICDFGSAAYKNEDSNTYTKYYASPEFLNDLKIKRNEKSDMWALGVIIIELHLKINGYFKSNNEDNSNINQLKFILSKYGINENIQPEEIKNIIANSSDSKIIKLNKEEIEKINDKDAIDLIQNLLSLNPEKRFNAEQVLNSKYLDLPNIKDIDSQNIVKIQEQKVYFQLYELIDKPKFLEIICELITILNKSK